MVTEGDISIIMTRIFDKLDSFEDKIDKICDRLTKLEMSVKEEAEKKKMQKSSNSERKYYVIIAAMGIMFGLYEIIKNI